MKIKAIVNHTGVCDGEHFEKGVETLLSEKVIAALGKSVKVLEEPKQEEKVEEKEVKEKSDKMIKNKETITK